MQVAEIIMGKTDAMQSAKHWVITGSQAIGTWSADGDILQNTSQLRVTVFIKKGLLILGIMTGVVHIVQQKVAPTPCTIAIVKVGIKLIF